MEVKYLNVESVCSLGANKNLHFVVKSAQGEDHQPRAVTKELQRTRGGPGSVLELEFSQIWTVYNVCLSKCVLFKF